MDGLRRRLARGGGGAAAAARAAPAKDGRAAAGSRQPTSSAPPRSVKEHLRAVLHSPVFTAVILVATLYSLFSEDVRLGVYGKAQDLAFAGLTACVVAALLVEIAFQCVVVDGYCAAPELLRAGTWARVASAADESDAASPPARDSIVLAALPPVARETPAAAAENAAPAAPASPLLHAWRRAGAAWHGAAAAVCAVPWRRSAVLAYRVVGLCAVGSFYFWLDMVAAASMVVELLQQLMDAGVASYSAVAAISASQVGITLARAGRAARAGARVGRLLRFLRLLRLLRRAQSAADKSSSSSTSPASSAGATAAAAATAPSETRVGAALTELMTRRVVVGVLLMILVVPFLTTALPDDSNALAARMLAAAVASQAAVGVAARHNWSTGAPFNASQLGPLDPLDPAGPTHLVLRTLAALRGNLVHVTVNGTPVRVVALQAGSGGGGGGGASRVALGEGEGDPPWVLEAQLRPSELGKFDVTVALHANGSAVPDGTPLARAPGWPFWGAVVPTGERVTLLAVSLWFSLREDTRMVALLDIGLILLVLLVLGVGAALFSFDINRLVLQPLEQLLAVARYISDHPLDQHAHQRRGEGGQPDRAASSALARRHGEHTALAAAAIDAHHRRSGAAGGVDREGRSCSGGASAEVQLLMSTLLNVGSLLRMAFGDAGAGMITANLNAAKELNPVLPGRRTHAVLVHVRVRHMALLHAALGDSVILLLNALAQVVHGVTLAHEGVVVRNTCDGWLLGWSLDEPATVLALAAASDRERGAAGNDSARGAAAVPASPAAAAAAAAAAPGDLHHTHSTPGVTLWSATADKALAASARLLLEVARRSDVLLGAPTAAGGERSSSCSGSGSGSGSGSPSGSPPALAVAVPTTNDAAVNQSPSASSAAAGSSSFLSLSTAGSFVARLSRRDHDDVIAAASSAAAAQLPAPPQPADLLPQAVRVRLRALLPHVTSAELLEVSLHAGWCIEGPLGSDKKINATFLGPHVTAVCELHPHAWCAGGPEALGTSAMAAAPRAPEGAHPRVLASHAFVLLLSRQASRRMRLHSVAAAPSGDGSSAAPQPLPSASRPSDAQLMAAHAVADPCFEEPPPVTAPSRAPAPPRAQGETARQRSVSAAADAPGAHCEDSARSTYDLPSCTVLLADVGRERAAAATAVVGAHERPAALSSTARHQVQALTRECAASYAHPLRLFAFPTSDAVLRSLALREPLEAPAAVVHAALAYRPLTPHHHHPAGAARGSALQPAPPPLRLGRQSRSVPFPRGRRFKSASLRVMQRLRSAAAAAVGSGLHSSSSSSTIPGTALGTAPAERSGGSPLAAFASLRDVRSGGAIHGDGAGEGRAASGATPPPGEGRAVGPALVVVTVADGDSGGGDGPAAQHGESSAWDQDPAQGRHTPSGSPSEHASEGDSVASSSPSRPPTPSGDVPATQPPPPHEPLTLFVDLRGPGEVAVAAAAPSSSSLAASTPTSSLVAAVGSFVAAYPRCPAGRACATMDSRCNCCGPLDEADLELLRLL